MDIKSDHQSILKSQIKNGFLMWVEISAIN